jgi:signal transduction histidine kinase
MSSAREPVAPRAAHPIGLRPRLILAAVYLLVVVVVALEVPLDLNISVRATQEFEAVVLSSTALVAGRINDDVATSAANALPAANVLTAIGVTARAAATRMGTRIVVTDRLGRILTDTSNEAPVGTVYATPARPEFEFVQDVPGGQTYVRLRPSETLGQDLLVVAVPVIHDRQVIGVVRSTLPLGDLHRKVHNRWLAFAGVGLAVVLVGLALAWFLASTLARPVRQLEEAAARLGQGDLEARAEPTGPKEVATLARAFNHMADTLAANMAAQREFVANASHQLRTPLTGLRLRLEAIKDDGGPAADQATKAEVEVDRLAWLVDDLLKLARASSTETAGQRLDLGMVARDAVERWTDPAESTGKHLWLEVDATGFVWADAADLEHALDNLIDNAIRYGPPGTTVTVWAGMLRGRPSVAVSDDGPGIAPEDRARIFDRFYRGASGRLAGPGTGLGLAIVGELVRRWGGEIQLVTPESSHRPREPEHTGARFEVTFPVPPTVP